MALPSPSFTYHPTLSLSLTVPHLPPQSLPSLLPPPPPPRRTGSQVNNNASVSVMASGVDPGDVAECPAPVKITMDAGWVKGTTPALAALATTVINTTAAAADTCSSAAPWEAVVSQSGVVAQVEVDMQIIGAITAIVVETLEPFATTQLGNMCHGGSNPMIDAGTGPSNTQAACQKLCEAHSGCR